MHGMFTERSAGFISRAEDKTHWSAVRERKLKIKRHGRER